MFGCDVFDCVPVMSRCIVFQQTSAIRMTDTPSVRWCARLDPSNADPVNPRIGKAIDVSSLSYRAEIWPSPCATPHSSQAGSKPGPNTTFGRDVSRRHIAAKTNNRVHMYICQAR